MQFNTWGPKQIDEADVASMVIHLRELQQHRNRLDAYETEVFNTVVANGLGTKLAASMGERDLAAALARLQGISRREAKRKRKTAESKNQQPDAGEAFDEGDINAEQLNDLADADVSDETRDRLLDQAKEQSSDETRKAIKDAEDEERTETPDERQKRQHSRRTARRFTGRDGMRHFEFTLDPASAAPVDAELTAIVDAMYREQKKDHTTHLTRPDQRLADAMVEIATRRTDTSATSVNRGASIGPARPQITITAGVDWLAGQLHALGITDTGASLAPSVLRQMACDADILPIVMGANSEPLDIGRGRRTVTDTQRRAVVARDGGCVWPNCNAPPHLCHTHHIVHWLNGGPTDLDNLALLCHRHHTLIHQLGYTLTRVGGHWTLTDLTGDYSKDNDNVTELFTQTA